MTPDPISSREDFLFPINKESSAAGSQFDSSQGNSHDALFAILSVLTESESQHRRAERAELLATARPDHEAWRTRNFSLVFQPNVFRLI